MTDFHDEATLAHSLQADYGFAEPLTVSLITDGQAGYKTYLALVAGIKYIARIYGVSWCDQEDRILFELEMLCYLKQIGIPVSSPVSRQDRELLGTISTLNGLRPYALFTFAEGTGAWPLGEEASQQLGTAMAALHLASNTFQSARAHALYDTRHLVDIPVIRMLPYLTNTEDRRFLEGLADQVRERLNRIPLGPDTFGVIHGDIHQGNCHFTSDGALMLFDFSLCGIGWRGFDITGFLWPLRDGTIHDPAIKRSCDAYLQGYQLRRPLIAEEAAALPAFVKIRDLWETGNWIELASTTDASVFASGISKLVEQFRTFPLEE